MAMGFYFSFGGVLTITKDYDPVVRKIPNNRILLETDAPYVAPLSYRGRRNEPVFMTATASRLAEIKGEKEENIAKITVENALKVFNIVLLTPRHHTI